MKSFRKWTIADVDDEFQLQQQRKSELLESWLEGIPQDVADKTIFPPAYLQRLQARLNLRVHDWNESELKMKFIAQLLDLVDFDQEHYQSFIERTISAPYKDGLSGDVDFLVAKGTRVPKQPYFFLHEHKKDADSSGDPLGQLMIAMVTAQMINETTHPIYGAYVVGRHWYFVVLDDKEYAVSPAYDATQEKLDDIIRILRNTKAIIAQLANPTVST
ncbi:MAG: hypothetical protein AAF639_11805 [Chloroflexota bacterium]